jgi:hypothetical protein
VRYYGRNEYCICSLALHRTPMEMMVKTDTSGNAMMSLWSQPSLQQGHDQSSITAPVAIPQTQAYFASGATNQQPILQQRQLLATTNMPNFYYFSDTNHPAIPLISHQSHTPPQLYAQAMPQVVQNQNSQVQQFQDEIEMLMMGTEATYPAGIQPTSIWTQDVDVDSTSAQLGLKGSSWQSNLRPIDRKANPITALTMADNATTFSWIGTEAQLGGSVPSYPCPESFDNDGMIPGLVNNPFRGIGSYSDRSEVTDCFSPISPVDRQFNAQNDCVRIRRNSDDAPQVHGLPFRNHEENHPVDWTGDDSSQSDWLIHGENKQCPDQPKTMQHIQPGLVSHLESYPIDHSQYSYSALTGYNHIERENDFGSPDLEDDFPNSLCPQTLASQSSPMTQTRNARDDLLVQMRRRGLPYKEIKSKGGYSEAESTLRGRFRTLTKEKNERVRKPHWQPEDVSITTSTFRSLHTNHL